jgi:hypothetical protein
MVHSVNVPTAVAVSYPLAPSAARRDRLMPRNLGSWNPRHCLVSVVDDRAAALAAAAALREAGFGDGDVRLAADREFIALDDAQQSRGMLSRFVAGMRAFGDESLIAAQYVAEARRGNHIVIVYAPGEARMRQALAVVARHRAHTVHYYGQWVIRGMANAVHAAPWG